MGSAWCEESSRVVITLYVLSGAETRTCFQRPWGGFWWSACSIPTLLPSCAAPHPTSHLLYLGILYLCVQNNARLKFTPVVLFSGALQWRQQTHYRNSAAGQNSVIISVSSSCRFEVAFDTWRVCVVILFILCSWIKSSHFGLKRRPESFV